jgi:hypothetical protein
VQHTQDPNHQYHDIACRRGTWKYSRPAEVRSKAVLASAYVAHEMSAKALVFVSARRPVVFKLLVTCRVESRSTWKLLPPRRIAFQCPVFNRDLIVTEQHATPSSWLLDSPMTSKRQLEAGELKDQRLVVFSERRIDQSVFKVVRRHSVGSLTTCSRMTASQSLHTDNVALPP